MPLNSDHAEPWLPEMQATKKHLNLEGHAAFKKSMHVSRCKLYHALFQPCTTLWMKAGLSILDRDFNAKSFFLGFFHFQGFLCADYTTLGIKQKMSFDEHSKLTWIRTCDPSEIYLPIGYILTKLDLNQKSFKRSLNLSACNCIQVYKCARV